MEITDPRTVLAELEDALETSWLTDPLRVVDSDALARLDGSPRDRLERAVEAAPIVFVGVGSARGDATDATDAFLTTVVLEADLPALQAVVTEAPIAAVVLDAVLRQTEHLTPARGLAAEAHAYGALLAGKEFARWREANPTDSTPGSADPASRPRVRATREDDRLEIVLDHPEVHNAFDAAMRDELCGALDIARADPDLAVRLSGAGPSFCAGGALWEFGVTEPASTIPIRRLRSPTARLLELGARAEVRLHGACVGAGIEMGAAAGRVVAAPDAIARLPEVSMGLIPGAGGTVSLVQRIGRHATARLALCGHAVDASEMLALGLVDEISPTTATASPT